VDSAEDNARFRRGAAREARQPIRFAGLVHGAQRHVCAFFHNPDEGVSGATFVHIRRDSSADRRPFISSIPSSGRNINSGWRCPRINVAAAEQRAPLREARSS